MSHRLLFLTSGDPAAWGGARSFERIAGMLEGHEVRFAAMGRAGVDLRAVLTEMRPTRVVAKDAAAVIAVDAVSHDVPIDYFVSAVQLGLELGNRGVRASKVLRSLEEGGCSPATVLGSLQARAITRAARVCAHSDQTDRMLRALFPDYAAKATPIVWTCLLRTAYSAERRSRDVAVTFAALDWRVRAKNPELVTQFVRSFPRDCAVVGAGLGRVLSREALRELFSRTRVVIVPSRYDAAPNVAVEAADAGCRVLVSSDVGSASLFVETMDLAEPVDAWAQRAFGEGALPRLPDGRDALHEMATLYE